MIIQVGPYPPPYGGISAYIKRMKAVLDSKQIANEVWNTSGEKNNLNIKKIKLRYIPFKIVLKKNVKLVHFNITGVKSKLYIGILNKTILRNKRKILTIHGDAKDLFIKNEFIMKKALNTFDSIICVKKGDKQYLYNKNIEKPIYEITAALPPVKIKQDYNELPNNVKQFICEDNTILISANGWIRFYNHEDLYGIDLLIELIYKLTINNYKVKIIIALLGIKQQNDKEKIYYLKLKNNIKNYNIEKNILIYEVENTEFYPILKNSDLFIRPTNTDGYGVSIAEAIYFNVPSIASDVCTRPKGTILFQNRNFEDLYNKVVDILENYDYYKKEVGKIEVEDNSEKILNVYKELLDN